MLNCNECREVREFDKYGNCEKHSNDGDYYDEYLTEMYE